MGVVVCVKTCIVDKYINPAQHIQYGTVRYSTVQYGTVRYSTIQYGTVRYSTVRYSTVQWTYLIICYNLTKRTLKKIKNCYLPYGKEDNLK